MISYHDAFHKLRADLRNLYDEGEASAIASWFVEELTGLSYTQRLAQRDMLMTEVQERRYNDGREKLAKGMPLQYVLGYGWFMGQMYKVNEHTLVPRPETEELVQWVTDDWQPKQDSISILDIGTGTGCIPISLKLKMPAANVTSCDISVGALKVAEENAARLQAPVTLLQLNFLEQAACQQLTTYNVIVSNPPYIPETEKETLARNVRDYEPGTALFVPGNDALLFYRSIAEFGKSHLAAGGAIYCELHRDYAEATKELFLDLGYSRVELRQDMHGNPRMLKAR